MRIEFEPDTAAKPVYTKYSLSIQYKAKYTDYQRYGITKTTLKLMQITGPSQFLWYQINSDEASYKSRSPRGSFVVKIHVNEVKCFHVTLKVKLTFRLNNLARSWLEKRNSESQVTVSISSFHDFQ